MCAKFEGWANKETWAVAIWIDNEQKLYEESQKIVEKYRHDEYELCLQIKNFVHKKMPYLRPGLASELLEIALSGVQWQEIVKHLLAD